MAIEFIPYEELFAPEYQPKYISIYGDISVGSHTYNVHTNYTMQERQIAFQVCEKELPWKYTEDQKQWELTAYMYQFIIKSPPPFPYEEYPVYENTTTPMNIVSSNKTVTDLYGDHLNNLVVFGNPDVEIEFQAHVKMEFWGENYISLCEEGIKGNPIIKNDVLEIDLDSRTLKWFKGDRPKWGSIHWVETLKEKPASNQWSLAIVDNNQFLFCYQQPLSELSALIPESKIEYFKKDDVDYIRLVYPPGGPNISESRPLDVDGSIAVYHKTKRNNVVGHKNYRTGKVLHIPRPKAIDSDGNWVWCDIQVKNKIYTRTIPQAFLDAAVYPVIINDTFGYWSSGGTEHSIAANYQIASGPYSPAGDGSATSITAYMKGHVATVATTLGIWNDNGGVPGTLAKDTAGDSNNNAASWKTQTLDSALSILGASSYHLGHNSDGTTDMYYDSDSFTEDMWYDVDTYNAGNLENFDPTIFQENRRYSIYVTYTPSVAGNAGIMTTNTGFWGPTF